MKEGIENNGPKFYPTCKMEKGRDVNECFSGEEFQLNPFICYNVGKNNQRLPSWCDRILYKTINESSKYSEIICNLYDRWEYKDITDKSDHSMVVGEFQIEPKSDVEKEFVLFNAY
jgi:hypothetical protein